MLLHTRISTLKFRLDRLHLPLRVGQPQVVDDNCEGIVGANEWGGGLYNLADRGRMAGHGNIISGRSVQ